MFCHFSQNVKIGINIFLHGGLRLLDAQYSSTVYSTVQYIVRYIVVQGGYKSIRK